MADPSACRRYWRGWRALPRQDRPILVALLFVLPTVAAGIRMFGLGRVQRTLAHFGTVRRPDGQKTAQDLRPLARLVELAANHAPGRPMCLPRSVTLWWLLRRRGVDSALRIGVGTVEGKLEAHAWVEHAGRVVNDSDDVASRFAPFEGLPLPAPRSRS